MDAEREPSHGAEAYRAPRRGRDLEDDKEVCWYAIRKDCGSVTWNVVICSTSSVVLALIRPGSSTTARLEVHKHAPL
jgi:hypothetical protein